MVITRKTYTNRLDNRRFPIRKMSGFPGRTEGYDGKPAGLARFRQNYMGKTWFKPLTWETYGVRWRNIKQPLGFNDMIGVSFNSGTGFGIHLMFVVGVGTNRRHWGKQTWQQNGKSYVNWIDFCSPLYIAR